MPSAMTGYSATYAMHPLLGPGFSTPRTVFQLEMLAEGYGVDPNHGGYSSRLDGDANNPYWPGASRMMGEALPIMQAPPDHTPLQPIGGGMGALGFNGITRDANNAPLAGVTVRLFRTVDCSLVAQTVSGPTGFYAMSSPWNDGHFIVCHKAGSPEIAGATASNLIGS